jgi:transcription elongation factor GreA
MNLENILNRKKRQKSEDRGDAEIGNGCRVSIVDLSTGELLDLKVVSSDQPVGQVDEVSLWSPLGRALLGRGVGESVDVSAPKGTVRYQILKITVWK